MKTSNKLLLATLLVLLASLTAYNMALRTEYRRGTYKDPLREYRSLPLKDFDEVEVASGSAANVKIMAGSYAVYLSPEAAGHVQVRQQGRRLVVTATFERKYRYLGGEAVVVSCPHLRALRADATYLEAGRPVVETHADSRHRILVQDFGPDTLQVQADRASQVELRGNHLAYLDAETGRHPGSTTTLTLADDNQVAAASLRMHSRSELLLNRQQIPGLRYELGDSVQVVLGGGALHALTHR